jgi:hypothetical protein
MTMGLIAATAAMIIEMLVFIMRALQIEASESGPSKKQKGKSAQREQGSRSGPDNKKQD